MKPEDVKLIITDDNGVEHEAVPTKEGNFSYQPKRVIKDIEFQAFSIVPIPDGDKMTKEERIKFCIDHGLGWICEEKDDR